jgi:Sulfatase-modifying factor enzyme 1
MRTAALVLALLCLGACARPEHSADRALIELERMSFVPAGRLRLDGFSPPLDDYTLSRPLLADSFEFSWGDWRALARAERALAPPADADPLVSAGFERGADDRPAVLGWRAAAALAEARGMRLPTPQEWTYLACGTTGLRYPWGPRDQNSVANTLELGLARTATVGTFEGGRGPFGHYELVGNVWEWVDGAVRGIEDGADPYPQPELARGLCSAMGGSFRVRRRELYVPAKRDEPAVSFALLLDREIVVDDIGFRAVVDAETFLLARADLLERAPRAEPRLRAIGRRIGSVGEPLLRALAEAPGASAALRWLHEGSLRP